LSTAYDELRVALEAYNEGPDREIGENMVHAAVRKIVRARRRAIERVADFEDVCQEVELSIALTMREHRRKVIDVLKEVSTIVERRIIDVNGRSKISRNTTLVERDRWERIEREKRDDADDVSDVHVRLLLGEIPGLTERDRVALKAMCDGNDAEGIRLALERHTGLPVNDNAAKQALFRAVTRLRKLNEGGDL